MDLKKNLNVKIRRNFHHFYVIFEKKEYFFNFVL